MVVNSNRKNNNDDDHKNDYSYYIHKNNNTTDSQIRGWWAHEHNRINHQMTVLKRCDSYTFSLCLHAY